MALRCVVFVPVIMVSKLSSETGKHFSQRTRADTLDRFFTSVIAGQARHVS
jgi:hypothetical protein